MLDVETIIGYALSLGPIAINRAFANWVSFNRHKQSLLQAAIELIQVFPQGPNAKIGADIKLCLDDMEDMIRFLLIGTIIFVGGDGDCTPWSYKVKAADERWWASAAGAGRTCTGLEAVRQVAKFVQDQHLHGQQAAGDATSPAIGLRGPTH